MEEITCVFLRYTSMVYIHCKSVVNTHMIPSKK